MMNTSRAYLLAALAFCGALSRAAAAQDVVIQARLFKGSRTAEAVTSDVVVSSFSDPLLVYDDPAKIRSDDRSVASMRAELFEIYHLRSLEYLTTSRFIWDGRRNNLGGTISLDEARYPIAFYPEADADRGLKLRVEVNQAAAPQEGSRALLTTEIDLTYDWPVVLGFPVNGHVYFLSISVSKRKLDSSDERVVPGAVSGVGYLAPPLPLYEVTPEYPEALKRAGVEGTVFLNINVDPQGRVAKVSTLIATHPDLESAARAAMFQWRYEPVRKNGKAIPVVFAVAVDFRLRQDPPRERPPASPHGVPDRPAAGPGPGDGGDGFILAPETSRGSSTPRSPQRAYLYESGERRWGVIPTVLVLGPLPEPEAAKSIREVRR